MFFREQFKQVGKLGYNTLFLMLSTGDGLCYQSTITGSAAKKACTREQLAGLIAYARSLGLAVVPEVKLWGKQEKTLGRDFLRAHRGMFAGPVSGKGALYDPSYRFPDGRGIHETLIFPLIEEVIGLFGETPPLYFNIGFDEYPTEYMAQLAVRQDITAPELMGREMNRLTDYILARGITPLIYQDMLIGPALAEEGHGVAQFAADPRFREYTTMHAQYPPQSKVSVLTAMNHIRNRDKIIVVDWHYNGGTPGDEFPSVDYFRAMGFKDVWGQTWRSENGIRTFAAYMAEHDGTGMIASTYSTARLPDVLHLYPRILHNSIIYFRNPCFTPPPPPTLRVLSGPASAPTVFIGPDGKLTAELRLPDSVAQVAESVLYLRQNSTQRLEVWQRCCEGTYDPARRMVSYEIEVSAVLAGQPAGESGGIRLFDARADVVDGQSGYLLQAMENNLFAVTRTVPDVAWPSAINPEMLLDLDFGSPRFLDEKHTMIAIPGARPMIGQFHKARITEQADGQVLRCDGKGGLTVPFSETILRRFAEAAVTFEVEFMLPQQPPNDIGMVFSYGSFHNGMRLYVSKNLAVHGQVAQRGGAPVRLVSSKKVQLNAWHRIQFMLSSDRKQAAITLDGKRVAAAPVPGEVPTSGINWVGVGLEVESAGRNGVNARREFPGLIRSFQMRAPRQPTGTEPNPD